MAIINTRYIKADCLKLCPLGTYSSDFLRKGVGTMSFKISTLADLSGAEGLMVAKIIDYPLEKAEYKPFAQARLCVLPEGLAVQLWAFEAIPADQSSLRAVLSGPNGAVASAQLWSSGKLEVLSGPDAAHLSPVPTLCTLSPLWGEDLQGRYWGGTLIFDRAVLEGLWGVGCLEPGGRLWGNLYKLSTDPQKPHMGSLFPADFAGGEPFGSGSFGEFELVSY